MELKKVVKCVGLGLLLQLINAVYALISAHAFQQGMSPRIFVVYRYLLVALVVGPLALYVDRGSRPPMTWSALWRIGVLGVMGPAVESNLSSYGLTLVSPTIYAALHSLIPAFTFIIEVFLRQETISWMARPSQAKILGTIVSIAGALIFTFYRGRFMRVPIFDVRALVFLDISDRSATESLTGILIILLAVTIAAGNTALAKRTLEIYPARLSLDALSSLIGASGASVFAAVIERDDVSVWALKPDAYLPAVLYGALVTSDIGFYIQGELFKDMGAVFVTSMQPLCVVFTAVLSCFAQDRYIRVSSVTGAAVIVVGLSLFVRGKYKESPVKQNGEEGAGAVEGEGAGAVEGAGSVEGEGEGAGSVEGEGAGVVEVAVEVEGVGEGEGEGTGAEV